MFYLKDMENYTRYKLMDGNILMKRNIVPHACNCQPNRKRTTSHFPSHPLPIKRERKRLVEEAVNTPEQRFVNQTLVLDAFSTSKFSLYQCYLMYPE